MRKPNDGTNSKSRCRTIQEEPVPVGNVLGQRYRQLLIATEYNRYLRFKRQS